MYKDKILLITGGTGSFGNAVLKRFINTETKRSGFSREMKKNRMICADFTIILK